MGVSVLATGVIKYVMPRKYTISLRCTPRGSAVQQTLSVSQAVSTARSLLHAHKHDAKQTTKRDTKQLAKEAKHKAKRDSAKRDSHADRSLLLQPMCMCMCGQVLVCSRQVFGC